MRRIRELRQPIERLTPAGAHCFFGYYDLPAWDAGDERHLCHQVPFWDRLPTGADIAVLGTAGIAGEAFIPFAETRAWNFQQGAMLQWSPGAPDREVIYNHYREGRYIGVVKRLDNGAERELTRPVASVAATGRHALSINFSRNFTFRPGYGYANLPDPSADQDAPADDGIFLIDMATGGSRLVLAYAEMASLFPDQARGLKLVVNHITFNPDGSRFVALLRNMPKRDGERWGTAIVTANADGGNVYPLRGFGLASHYHWRDPGHLLIWSDAGGAPALYLLKDRSSEAVAVDPVFFACDGHCSYSPDRRWILYDSYPVDQYRYLYLYHVESRKGMTLGAFHSPPEIGGDIRCDLHPRWNRAGTAIAFDSTHDGFRAMYRMDLREIVAAAAGQHLAGQ